MARFRACLWPCAVLALLAPPSASAAPARGPDSSEDGRPAPAERPLAEVPVPVVVVRPGDDPAELARSALAGVTAVEVVGHVPEQGGLARLTLTLDLYARGPGPHRIPIGLDGLYPREAVADDVPLAWEAAPPDGWFVLLPGEPGAEQLRTIRVEVVAPVRTIDDRRVLSLAIPRAARTRLSLDLAGPVAEAALGEGAPLPVEAIDDGRRSRIEALVDARNELEIRWLPRRDETAPVPPLLTGGGHLALDLSDGALTAQSTWEIQVRRGEVASLVLLTDPEDELLEVEVEGRSILPGDTPDGRGRLLPLPRVVRKGDAIRVAMTTRRPIPSPSDPSGLVSVRFAGHPFEGLVEQTGTLSVARTDGLRILADPELGLRRIDPRDLIPEIARTRPTIVSAFRFADQPFRLRLRVGAMPPLVRVGQRALAQVEPGGTAARVETWLDYRSVRGQCFALRIEVPEGMEVDRVGPPEAIASWDLSPPDGAEGRAGPGPAVLELTLASALRDVQLAPLRVELAGRVRLDPDPGGPIRLPMFRPEDAAFDGGRLAVAVPPDLEVAPLEAPAADDAPGAATPAESPPALEPGPWSRAGPDLTRRALWLRFDAPIEAVSLALSPRARSASSMIDQLVRVGRDGVEVQQDLTLYAPDGELRAVELAIPIALERGWELVDRGVIDEEEPIPPGPDGRPIRRLRLSQTPTAGPIKLRLRYRVPEVGRLTAGRAAALEIPRIEVLEPRPIAPPRVEVAADPGIDLRPDGDGWRRPAESQWVTNPDGGSPLPIRLVWVRPAGQAPEALPRLSVTAAAPAPLPRTLASRLWLRTEQGPDGALRTAAWFRFDDHGPSIGFRIPSGAELERVYVGGEPVPSGDLDALERPGSYLLHLPPEAGRTLLLGLSYRIPREAVAGRFQPPRLLDGGHILETLWEVRLPWSRAWIGVPRGFNDENLWHWGGYVWKRRPALSADQLASWIAGPGASAETLAPPLTGGRVGDHGYLFSRPGAPVSMGSASVSRALLVGACSGAVLLLGLLGLVRHPIRRRALPAVAGLVLPALVLMGPITAVVALQSSAVGWLLVAVAALTRRAVERRRPIAPFGEQSALASAGSNLDGQPVGVGVGLGVGGSGGSAPPVGSEDSTAIRPRPPLLGGPTPTPRPVAELREEVIDIPPPRADREAS